MTTKQELIQDIAERTGETKRCIGAILDALGDSVASSLRKGNELTLPGIGKLKPNYRPARDGRNPLTGETVPIQASVAVKFKVLKVLKDALN